jgi:signal transduction histidine kinase
LGRKIMNELKRRPSTWGIGRQFALVMCVWVFFCVFNALNIFVDGHVLGESPTWRDVVGYPLASYGMWSLFTVPILLMAKFIRNSFSSRWLWTMAHMVGALLVMVADAVGWMLVPSWIRQDLAHQPHLPQRFVLSFATMMEWNFWLYWTIVGIAYGVQYYYEMQDARVYAAELESELTQAQLQTLKQQLRPHFLFNTLNAISGLVHINPRAADDMIGNLSSLLRLSLEAGEVQNVSLRDELRALQLYIDIQQVRFGNRFKVEQHIDPTTLEAFVPHLILQPLVENAFHHGIAKRTSHGLLRIEATRLDGMVRLLVADNGPGSKGKPGNGTGIGLKNSRARLRRLYGETATLNIQDTPHGFTVEAVFPAVGEAEELK